MKPKTWEENNRERENRFIQYLGGDDDARGFWAWLGEECQRRGIVNEYREMEVKMDENKCELCGATATHFCECMSCQEAAGEDDHGRRPNDELGEGRWLCDECLL